MDIRSNSKYPANKLSNFAGHRFELDGVVCNSMEGFLQAVKFSNPNIQEEVCKLVGFAAKKKGSKKKSPMFLFIVAFAVIIIVMIVANQSKDENVSLEMPFNEGVRSLSTFDNKLLAVASDGKTYLWDWKFQCHEQAAWRF